MFEAVLALGDDLARSGEDGRVGAVVVRQDDNLWVLVLLAKPLDITDIGTLKTKYRLVVVTHCHDIWLVIVGQ